MNDKRELRYICENCFHILPGIMTMSYPDISKSDVHIDSTGISHLFGNCPRCKKQTFFFTVDRYMTNIISILNKTDDYETDYCCQGHSYTKFVKNLDKDNNSYHVAYKYDRPYISFKSSSKNRSATLLSCLIESGFDTFYFTKSSIEYINKVPKKRWNDKDPFAVYLNQEYIELMYKQIVKGYEGKPASKEVLYGIDKKMDKIFEDRCKELAKLLKENKNKL